MLQIPPTCDLTLGLTRVAGPDGAESVWRTTIDERFLNPAGSLQGGFLAAIADSAMGAAAVRAVGERKVFVANTDLRISFLRPVPPGATLTCTATVVKAGSLVTFVEAEIVNEDGATVATASSTYVIRDRTE